MTLNIAMFLALIWTAQLGAAPAISPGDAAAKIKASEAVLIDVRELDEIKADGMAEPASWIATSEAKAKSSKFAAFVASLDKKKTVILYCRSGNRAGSIADTLEQQGFKTANMGGFREWKAAGLPTKKAP